MMMESGGMSPADMAAVFGNRDRDDYGMSNMWNNPWHIKGH